jgi:hypothetical protein
MGATVDHSTPWDGSKISREFTRSSSVERVESAEMRRRQYDQFTRTTNSSHGCVSRGRKASPALRDVTAAAGEHATPTPRRRRGEEQWVSPLRAQEEAENLRRTGSETGAPPPSARGRSPVVIDRTSFVPNRRNPPRPDEVLGVARKNVKSGVHMASPSPRWSHLTRASADEASAPTAEYATHATAGSARADADYQQALCPFAFFSTFGKASAPKPAASAWARAPRAYAAEKRRDASPGRDDDGGAVTVVRDVPKGEGARQQALLTLRLSKPRKAKRTL